MALAESTGVFVREYYDYNRDTDTKKLLSRWHYNIKKFANGPILVENFDTVDKEKKKKSSKEK